MRRTSCLESFSLDQNFRQRVGTEGYDQRILEIQDHFIKKWKDAIQKMIKIEILKPSPEEEEFLLKGG